MDGTEPIQRQNFELRFAHIAPNVWRALGEVKRTGWVQRGVENPESDQEHTIVLMNTAASLFDELSEEEKDGLFDMLEVHEWPEALLGDPAILIPDESEFNLLKANKFEKEKMALASICDALEGGGRNYGSMVALCAV